MRGATSPAAVITTWPGLFQSTHPCGARHAVTVAGDNRVRVSIHAPVRGATVLEAEGSVELQVSIHAPVRGATTSESPGRTRAGVSIHAPVRGATRSSCRPAGLSRVSIHAPVRGATREERCSRPARRFQSTRPCGARRIFRLSHVVARVVSIHAPVRGATAVLLYVVTHERVSIHAPVRGATHTHCNEQPLSHSFNPRARAGRDRGSRFRWHGCIVSIHAPVRGAT